MNPDLQSARKSVYIGEGLIGGDDGIRTHDLCSAIAALSQLSYIPGKD